MRKAVAMTVKVAALAASSIAIGVLAPSPAIGVDAPPDPSHGDITYIVPSTNAAPTTPPSVPRDSGTSLLAAVVIAAAAGSLLTELATSHRSRRPGATPRSTSPADLKVSTRTPSRGERDAVPRSHIDASRDDAAGGRSRPSAGRRRLSDGVESASEEWGPWNVMECTRPPSSRWS